MFHSDVRFDFDLLCFCSQSNNFTVNESRYCSEKVFKKIASIKKTKKIDKCYCVEKSVMQMLYFDTDSYSLIQQNSQFERGNEMVQLNLILCVSSDNVTDPEYTS